MTKPDKAVTLKLNAEGNLDVIANDKRVGVVRVRGLR